MGENADSMDVKLYHERQVRELCALHALNNLMQSKQAFTKKDLDEICNRLSPGSFINPHRSMLGLGNYDVNVLMAALQQKGLETIWFDKRKDVDVLIPDNIMGFIINMPVEFKLGFVKIRRKHWIAIRWLQGQYMNLDSKLDCPVGIGDTTNLLQYFRSELSEGDKELFLVVEQSVYETSSWRRESSCSSQGKQSLGNESANSTNCNSSISDASPEVNEKVSQNGTIVQGAAAVQEKTESESTEVKNCDSDKTSEEVSDET